jgi:hypothetical protein
MIDLLLEEASRWTVSDGALARECDRLGVGPHAVARGPRGGPGRAENRMTLSEEALGVMLPSLTIGAPG